jgi:hypothetical protein
MTVRALSRRRASLALLVALPLLFTSRATSWPASRLSTIALFAALHARPTEPWLRVTGRSVAALVGGGRADARLRGPGRVGSPGRARRGDDAGAGGDGVDRRGRGPGAGSAGAALAHAAAPLAVCGLIVVIHWTSRRSRTYRPAS